MGSSELDELCPLVYQVLPSIYGTTSSSSKKKAALLNSSLDLRQQYQNNTENLKPIPIHQIFNINVSLTCLQFFLEYELLILCNFYDRMKTIPLEQCGWKGNQIVGRVSFVLNYFMNGSPITPTIILPHL